MVLQKLTPSYNDLKYHSTNVGMGYSTFQSDSIFGWNTGLEAVQVNDIDMNSGLQKVGLLRNLESEV